MKSVIMMSAAAPFYPSLPFGESEQDEKITITIKLQLINRTKHKRSRDDIRNTSYDNLTTNHLRLCHLDYTK
jgi:hypothetical protein